MLQNSLTVKERKRQTDQQQLWLINTASLFGGVAPSLRIQSSLCPKPAVKSHEPLALQSCSCHPAIEPLGMWLHPYLGSWATKHPLPGQSIFFPLGLVALPFFPFIIDSILGGTLDREGVIDPPLLVNALTHTIWCIVASATFFVLRKGLQETNVVKSKTQ